MPHIRLEYTSNMNIAFKFEDFFAEIHQTLHEIAGIKISNCKSRAFKLSDYFIGSGGDSRAFVNLDIRILEGRNEDLKKELGNQLLALLKKFFPMQDPANELQITIEIHDIKKEMYFKHPDNLLNY